MNKQRINLRKLAQILLLTLVLPCSGLIGVDFVLGTSPIFTLVAILLCIPTAAFLLNRTALQEMDRIIQEVAPLLPETELPETELPETEPSPKPS